MATPPQPPVAQATAHQARKRQFPLDLIAFLLILLAVGVTGYSFKQAHDQASDQNQAVTGQNTIVLPPIPSLTLNQRHVRVGQQPEVADEVGKANPFK
jgi:uncharacterized protein HemX